MLIRRNLTKNVNLNCLIFNKTIENVDSIQSLGVMFQADVSWDLHIDKTKKTLNSANFALLSLRNIVSRDTLKSVYNAYVFNHLSFGILLWGAYDKAFQTLFVIQKRVLRIKSNIRPYESCRSHLEGLEILTVPCIFIFVFCM
jgi:hypothetical protein